MSALTKIMSVTCGNPNHPARYRTFWWRRFWCLCNVRWERLAIKIARFRGWSNRRWSLVCNWISRHRCGWLTTIVRVCNNFWWTEICCAFVLVQRWCDTILLQITCRSNHLSVMQTCAFYTFFCHCQSAVLYAPAGQLTALEGFFVPR